MQSSSNYRRSSLRMLVFAIFAVGLTVLIVSTANKAISEMTNLIISKRAENLDSNSR